jgi:uncharacterized protein YkwD
MIRKVKYRYKNFGLVLSFIFVTLFGITEAYSLLGVPEVEKRPVSFLEKLIYEKVNEVRKEYNLPRLEWADDVADVARKHSEDMGIRGYFAHEDKKGELVSERLAKEGIVFTVSAENIFKCTNYPDVVEEAVRGWMESPGHRENILNDEVTETGVGIYKVRDEDEYYITQNFIKRALKFIPLPKPLSEKKIGQILNIVRDTISEATHNYRNPTSSLLKDRIFKKLRSYGITVEKDFIVEGFLKDSPALRLKVDLRVERGMIINFTNKKFEEDKRVFSQLINPKGYSAVILIRPTGKRIEYLLIKSGGGSH